LKVFQMTSVLVNDFSRRHLCQNPPALAGGRLSKFTLSRSFLSDCPKFLKSNLATKLNIINNFLIYHLKTQ
ncbi:hypothetical protein, partial [Metabacillus arenae]|uniref:hypothetical protein n=1 Tax=Metabacillus arenae TaxID=2771434 RepID=UPI001CD0B960